MCLASLAAQSFKEWEAVIVNDGSQDATGRILRDWSHRDPRIRPFNTPPQGLIISLNFAASKARGRTFFRQDADDTSHPDRFQEQIQALLNHPEWDVIATGVTIFPEPAPGLSRYQNWINSVITPEEIARDIWIESPIPHPTVAMRRETFEEAGGYRDMGWPEDYDLWLRLHLQGKGFAKIPKVLYAWRDSPGRLSRTHDNYSAEAFRRCKAHHLSRILGDQKIWICGAGPFGRKLARALDDAGITIHGFLDIDRLRVGRMVQGARVEDLSILKGGPVAHQKLLVCVGVHGARDLIRRQLTEWNYRETTDYLIVS